ncbi:MAG: hypothetical protein P4L84_03495 [Isosphaeraceae bacterium]|nr:hypothetical protein [Isosphaeraceae bacterium]
MSGNPQTIQSQWHALRSEAKERWGQLTDDDLRVQLGNVDQLVDRIQKRTGEAREAIEKVLSDMTAQGSSAVSHAAEAVGHFAHQAGEQARERYGRAEDLVRDNPTRSVLAILGIGLVAGLIVGLSLRHR